MNPTTSSEMLKASEVRGLPATVAGERPGSDDILTMTELAARLKQAVRTVERWHQKGVVLGIKVDNMILFYWPSVLKRLRERYEEKEPQSEKGKANMENFEDLRRRLFGKLRHEFSAYRGLLTFGNGSRIVAGRDGGQQSRRPGHGRPRDRRRIPIQRREGQRRASPPVSNLHQIGIALGLYIQDNDHRLPVCAQLPSLSATNLPGLPTVLAMELPAKAIWQCPGDSYFFATNQASYEWNQFLNGASYDRPQDWSPATQALIDLVFGGRLNTPLVGDAVAFHEAEGNSTGKNALFFDDRVEKTMRP